MDVRGEGHAPAVIDEARRRVFGLCRLLLGSVDQAEDATSEVFVKTQQAIATYDESRTPFLPWALAIARNHCFDLLRRRKVETRIFASDAPTESALASPAPSPLRELLGREERAGVREAVAALPERARSALVLRYFEDLSYDEIGRVLDLTPQGVGTLIFRAKQQLRERVAALPTGGRR